MIGFVLAIGKGDKRANDNKRLHQVRIYIRYTEITRISCYYRVIARFRIALCKYLFERRK